MATLTLKNVRKAYDARTVPVKDLTLTVAEGEFLTLLGPSGCGKSTTLRLIAGLERTSGGEIRIGDRLANELSPGDRNVAMVFQSYALYPHLSVFENIASPLTLQGLSRGEIRDRVVQTAQTLGLDDLLQRKPGQLSGGQRQRVALGRALVRQPDVFLLDEPLSNLDALLREQVRAELKQIFARQSAPVVYVTHDQTEAMTLSSKVAVLCDGELQQLAPPQEIYDRPANQFVAGFVGSPQMNFLTLDCKDGKAPCQETALSMPAAAVGRDRVVLGIRPEHVTLAQPGDPETIAGEIFLVEPIGPSVLLDVRMRDSERTLRLLIPSDRPVPQGQVQLALPERDRHWFDIETGQRLD
ncbi:MAG: ABC transporter ATP-binding protein [Cyanobacteria bacterium J06641_5]